ncbi:uncharacterized protein LOC123523811 [Mercenaria mercenaria]|uniref:uncharacterized protein LOC123523811 n=1 Tax=Mercenaria mercenaria TaxID=6596 RepID=UPI00234E5E46|nr:uncharacterized protein LOC123523811 [Mercenaria mercenaria]
MNIGPDSVVVGFTSSLAGVIILLVFASIIWFIRREVRGKHYGNPKVSSRDTSAPIYDDIPDNDDTTEVSRVSGSHLYMEVGTAHTPRGIHEYGPKKLNSSDTGISCNWAKTLAVFEAISDTPLVCAKALSMYTLHSEVSNYNNSDVIHTSSFVSLDNAEVHRKSSNLSRKYYEVPDKITGVNYNLTIERNHTNDDNEIPISSACPTAEIAEADGASLSGQCNTLADSTTSPTRDSKRTRNNDLISTRNNEIDVSDNNQTLQKAKEDKYNLRPPGFHIDMPLETHQTQENLYEEDSVTLNYIHPVN